jgi:hypothetical protein
MDWKSTNELSFLLLSRLQEGLGHSTMLGNEAYVVSYLNAHLSFSRKALANASRRMVS